MTTPSYSVQDGNDVPITLIHRSGWCGSPAFEPDQPGRIDISKPSVVHTILVFRMPFDSTFTNYERKISLLSHECRFGRTIGKGDDRAQEW